MRKISIAIVAAATLATPSVAKAQDAETAGEGFVGLSAGYHDLGAPSGFGIDDSSPIVGVFAGYDLPLGAKVFAGVEGNYHLGTDVIDSEYGASVRLGFGSEGGAKFYARGGYQWVDLDVYKIADIEPDGSLDGLDDTDGDYLVGLGVDFPVGGAAVRVNIDTISFDTVRATTGVAFAF